VLHAWGPLHAERAPQLLPQHEVYLARKAGELAARRGAAAAEPAHAQLLAWPGPAAGA